MFITRVTYGGRFKGRTTETVRQYFLFRVLHRFVISSGQYCICCCCFAISFFHTCKINLWGWNYVKNIKMVLV